MAIGEGEVVAAAEWELVSPTQIRIVKQRNIRSAVVDSDLIVTLDVTMGTNDDAVVVCQPGPGVTTNLSGGISAGPGGSAARVTVSFSDGVLAAGAFVCLRAFESNILSTVP